MSQVVTVIMVFLAGGLAFAGFAIYEKLRNQRWVEGGGLKVTLIPNSGRSITVKANFGGNTPQGQEVVLSKQYSFKREKDEEVSPIYYTNKFSTLTDRYPGGKGIWSRIISVEVPWVTYFMGDPRPAIYHSSAFDEQGKLKEEAKIIVANINGYLADEKATQIAMTVSARNSALEDKIRTMLNPIYVYALLFGAALLSGVCVFYVLKLNSNLTETRNELNSTIDALKVLLGG